MLFIMFYILFIMHVFVNPSVILLSSSSSFHGEGWHESYLLPIGQINCAMMLSPSHIKSFFNRIVISDVHYREKKTMRITPFNLKVGDLVLFA